jgi:hypothetical protein
MSSRVHVGLCGWLVVASLLASGACARRASAQAEPDGEGVVTEAAVPAPPAGSSAPASVPPTDAPTDAIEGAPDARELADPFAIALRTRELDALLRADAQAAESARTFGAVTGFVIGGLGIGVTPVLFALDDGSGLLPILSIVTVQLGALGLAGAIVSAISPSTEERRLARWRALGTPHLEDLARVEGLVLADADRALDGRVLTLAQGVAGLATGVFTGLVGILASRAEVTQITLGTLGGVEVLVGLLQLIGALEPGEVEARPSRYEARTGVRLSWLGSGLAASF